MPRKSPGVTMGRVLFVTWRNPFSHTASILYPAASARGASAGQKISRSMRRMCSRSRTRYGISKMANSSTTDSITVEFRPMWTVPSLSFLRTSSSPPNWAEPNTTRVARSSSSSFARRANSSADKAISDAGGAECASLISSPSDAGDPQAARQHDTPAAIRETRHNIDRRWSTATNCARGLRRRRPWLRSALPSNE